MSVWGNVFGNVWGNVWGSIASQTTNPYLPVLELFEVEQGTVSLYWNLPEVGTVSFTVLLNEETYATQTTGSLTVSNLLPDTEYAFCVTAAYTPPVTSQVKVYSYSSRNSQAITAVDRLKPFPTTQLP